MKRSMLIRLAVWLLCSTGLLGAGMAEDWPMWRGARGDGVSREQQAPLTWSDSQNVRWKSPIRGRGLSSPIVVGSSVYVTTFIEEEGSRRLLNIDRSTGQIVWEREMHRGAVEQQHRFNSCASSTPAADAESVYCMTVDDERMWVVAFDHKGNQRWKVTPGKFASQHGFAASPVVFNGSLFVNGQQDGEAFVVALDCRSGETRWRYKPDINLRSFSTPVLIDYEGKTQLILAGANRTVGLAPDSGELIWFATGPNQKVVSTPSIANGMVFSFAGSPSEKAMAVRLGGQGDVSDSHIVWRSEKAMPYVPSPVIAGGLLHVINDAGIYSCIELETGKILKTVRRGGNTYSSPIAAAGRVYLFEDSGRCTVIADDANYQVLAVNELGEGTQCTPAVSNAELFIRTTNHLWCVQ